MIENKKYNYLVRVDCITYNHAPYIVDAMNGFCMQKTNFPFVAVILDDTSTDGEPEVIKQYLQEHFDLEDKDIVRNEETDDYILTFARHKDRKQRVGSLFPLLKATNVLKYIDGCYLKNIQT